MMNEQVKLALERGRTIDITTTGRKTGQPRRIETWYHNLDGRIYLTGTPGKRDWYANLQANPYFTFHMKQDIVADLAARAQPIDDLAARRAILTRILQNIDRSKDLDSWIAGSPLVEVEFLDS
jgi:deazaflavin-dependent oxidoreductase (nitroreductase family)